MRLTEPKESFIIILCRSARFTSPHCLIPPGPSPPLLLCRRERDATGWNEVRFPSEPRFQPVTLVPSSRLRLLSASASTGRNGVSEVSETQNQEAGRATALDPLVSRLCLCLSTGQAGSSVAPSLPSRCVSTASAAHAYFTRRNEVSEGEEEAKRPSMKNKVDRLERETPEE